MIVDTEKVLREADGPDEEIDSTKSLLRGGKVIAPGWRIVTLHKPARSPKITSD